MVCSSYVKYEVLTIKKKSFWSSIRLFFQNILNITGEVKRPKVLGDIRGISYIYQMIWKFGVIEVPEKIREKME